MIFVRECYDKEEVTHHSFRLQQGRLAAFLQSDLLVQLLIDGAGRAGVKLVVGDESEEVFESPMFDEEFEEEFESSVVEVEFDEELEAPVIKDEQRVSALVIKDEHKASHGACNGAFSTAALPMHWSWLFKPKY